MICNTTCYVKKGKIWQLRISKTMFYDIENKYKNNIPCVPAFNFGTRKVFYSSIIRAIYYQRDLLLFNQKFDIENAKEIKACLYFKNLQTFY